MKALTLIGGALVLLCACTNAHKEKSYYVEAKIGDEFNGKTAYLYDIDRNINIDSAVVTESVVVFGGTLPEA